VANGLVLVAISSQDTKALIGQALQRLFDEAPALRGLKLVVKLELPSHGGGAPVWRVEVPGPKIDRDPAADARVDVSIPRSHFNELARDGSLRHWVEAYEHGHVKVAGDPGVVKLIGAVIVRQRARARA
jgi:hypothetical protein